MNKLFVFFFLIVSTFVSCKKKTDTTPSPSSSNNSKKIVYGGPQKDNQYLSNIISTQRNYDYTQVDSLLLIYDKNKQLISTINYELRSGYNITNGFIKKYESTLNYDTKGNLIELKTVDLENKYVATYKFEYDEATNQLSKISGVSQGGSYSEFILKMQDTATGFNLLRNGFLKSENTFVNENLTRYYEKDAPLTFDYQDYDLTKMNPFYALPQNMAKIFYCTENAIQLFTISNEYLNCLSKNIATKIKSEGVMNTIIELKPTSNSLGYITELSIGDTSSFLYRKFKFSYNNK